MESFYHAAAPRPRIVVDVDDTDDDFEAIMNKMTVLEPYDGGDMFEDHVFTDYFTEELGEETVSAIRDEFVSWQDVSVGTVREMMDLMIDVDHARFMKATLNAAKEAVEGRSIDELTLDAIKALKVTEEDLVAAHYGRREDDE